MDSDTDEAKRRDEGAAARKLLPYRPFSKRKIDGSRGSVVEIDVSMSDTHRARGRGRQGLGCPEGEPEADPLGEIVEHGCLTEQVVGHDPLQCIHVWCQTGQDRELASLLPSQSDMKRRVC